MTESEGFPGKLDHVVDLQVPLTVVLAEKSFCLEEILELRPGAILQFSRRHDAPLDALLNGARLGRGRALDVGERLGFRLDEIAERPPSMRPSPPAPRG